MSVMKNNRTIEEHWNNLKGKDSEILEIECKNQFNIYSTYGDAKSYITNLYDIITLRR